MSLIRAIRAAAFVVVSVAGLPSASHAASAVSSIPSATVYADGTVLATAAGADRIYVGGDFSLLGRPTGSWASIGADGKPAAGRPPLFGTVDEAVSDGSGGWFVAGRINAVGSVVRAAKVVHLRPNGELDRSWRLAIQGGDGVSALVRRGGTLFLAGDFRKVGGQVRQGIAAVSASSHRLLPWHLQGGAWFVEKGKRRTPAGISTLALANGGRTLYLAGAFNRIGKLTRSRLAEASVATGRVTAWNPRPNSSVSTIEPAPGRPVVYVGGNFTRIGKRRSNSLAALDARTGKSISFDAGASPYQSISDILATHGTLYVAGGFTELGGKSRHLVAALDPRTGAVTGWEPNVTGDEVTALALDASQSTLYIAGDIVEVGGQRRDRLAGIDAHSGAVTGWDPPALGEISLLARGGGGTIFAGGEIAFVGGIRRHGLASLTPDGAITDWDPALVGTVRALALSPDASKLYVGGAFAPGDAPAQRNLAVVDISTGALHAFGGGTSSGVWALAPTADGSKLYIGGAFTTVVGKRRTRLAQLNAQTGELTSWNSGANDLVRALISTPDELYVGGDFTSTGGQPRSRLAKLDAETGAALGWDTEADDKVWTLALRDETVYAGGDFESIGGKGRNALAALDTESGQASQWDPNADSTVRTLKLSLDRGRLFAGGEFEKIGRAPRAYAEFLLPGGSLTGWDPPGFDGYSSAFTSDGSTLVFGGDGGVDIFH
jgi:trimeric autotransporter adhesin